MQALSDLSLGFRVLCLCDVVIIAFHVMLHKKLEIEFMKTLKKYLIEFMERGL